ncbi:toll/interleukin-1 receptor domain-containing protein [Desulfovibrio sp. 86]|uniref:TIR domain-containing protein n=1 Tax=uncultured Desulfovibrio sp. TaxID=167968 RepID=A0A212L7M1_9BACT|nr:toll/interleukin-1 receptor domain-containing protein [Desulfovibrio sp. 86]SCM73573.1 hypothetical protein KL86DES1_21388 [uncultured Desulfovibrio sp.]VZH34285.1 conserved protein of unknown function [Desulfovibrio sp. 86]
MLVKAFLSHHSADKDIVRPIADNLTRLQCYFDEQSFESGVTFDESIQAGLSDSLIFVLIIGKETLGREYVKKEISLAKELYQKSLLRTVLTFIISDDVDLTQIPTWMKKIKYEISTDVSYITRSIQSKIDSISTSANSAIIGRDADSSDFEALTLDKNKKNNVYFFSGLSGIGRKTFSKHILKTKLSLPIALIVDIKPGDGPLEVAFNIRDKYDIESKEDEKLLYIAMCSKNMDEKNDFLIAVIKSAVSRREAIILDDQGGLFKIDGTTNEDIIKVLNKVSLEKNLPVFVVTKRTPSIDLRFKHLHLRALTQIASKILLTQLTQKAESSAEDLDTIVNVCNGYPPSIQYSAELIERYGVDKALIEKIKKSSFSIFADYLNDLQITDEAKQLLVLLIRYSPLSIAMISEYMRSEAGKVFDIVSNLIDNSILEVVHGNFYEISKPIEYNVTKLLEGEINTLDHARMAAVLQGVLERCGNQIKLRLLFERLLTRSKLFSNVKYNKADMFSFTSDILRMAQDEYNDKEYKKAIEYSEIVINEDANSSEAFEIIIKSHIHDDNFKTAEEYIERYKKFGRPQSIHFLEGFLSRYDNKIDLAIKSYNFALENGYRGASIHRELAQCYILLPNDNLALKHAQIAYEMNDNNIFILDIYANALSRTGQQDAARGVIEKMLKIQESDFTLLRASVFEFARSNYSAAYSFVMRAVKIAQKPTFELCFQAAMCCLEHQDDISGARDIYKQITEKFKNKRPDVQSALLMRIYIAEKNSEAAKLIYNKIKNSSTLTVVNVIRNLSSRNLLPL